MSSPPILIVGGGLGGLTAAIALGQSGRPVHVLEQAPEIAPLGYGIQLGPNVFPIFERLGLKDAVLAASDRPPALLMPDALTGEILLRVPLASARYVERFRHPYVVIHRADLHSILLEAVQRIPAVQLTVEATASGYRATADQVQVQCEDGRSFAGVALVAADGLWSRMRCQMVANEEPRATGYVAHRTVLNMAAVPSELEHRDEVVLWAGPGYHVVHYPLRKHSCFNVVAVFQSQLGAPGTAAVEHAAQVASVYQDSAAVLRGLVARMDLQRRWVIADRDPIKGWATGRVTLIGDACHPALQSYAQGACMAIEDAWCLAAAVARAEGDYPEAFANLAKQRRVRTARLQLESRSLWEFYHAAGSYRERRNAEARARTAEDSYDCLAWLWNHVC